MQPDAFDTGWIFLGVLLLAGVVWWDLTRGGEPVHDEDEDLDWDVTPRKHDPEAEARHWPF